MPNLLAMIYHMFSRPRDPKGRLFAAARDGKAGVAEEILRQNPLLANASHSETDRSTPLGIAALRGRLDVVRVLLDNGADINGPGTPLCFAAMFNRTDIARLLLEKGADPRLTGLTGDTPMSIAKKLRLTAIIELLQQHGAF